MIANTSDDSISKIDGKKPSYLFTSTEAFSTHDMIGRLSIVDERFHKEDVKIIDEDDPDLLPHSAMSWGSLEERYVPFEILSEDSMSITSESSSSTGSNLSFSLLDQTPLSVDQEIIACAMENSWTSYALDINLWDDNKAPVVKLRNVKDILFDELEFCGFFTDRMIGAGKSFLTKSPENGLYVLNKCVMRNMSLSNITMLNYHRYLQYIDLAYNYITNLSPLGGIAYLMYLNVSHNRMNTILNFAPPWYLTYVNLSYNYISKMRDISQFWSIVHLDLSHNAIESISGLENLKYLKYLNLSYNLIEQIENLDKLNIQELNLEGNCILSFKSAVPGYGINTLPHLRKIYLGYNKLSTLEFFKDSYSLRVIDLKFNRINDLLELQNFKGLIQEIDLRGNGCTKWPNYKAVLLFSLPSIQTIDGVHITSSEKIAAVTLFASPVNLTAARTTTKLILLEQLSTPKIDLHVTPYDEVSPPLIILTGPSALKKLSLAIHITQTLSKKVRYCRWYTTKKSEDQETENECYIFVNREEFNDMSRRGEFLAIQEQLGNSYGFHHNEIISLRLENKVGITQMDLHATIQMSRRYSNSKLVLVLTKSEEIHREWIQQKFDVYTCTKESRENVISKEVVMARLSDVNFIRGILNNIIQNLKLPTKITFNDEYTLLTEAVEEIEMHGTEMTVRERRVSEPGEEINSQTKDIEAILQEHKRLRVILDEHANVIIEDEQLKRKRHQARLLHRRDTLMRGGEYSPLEDLSESISSEEMLTKKSLEVKEPEHMKDFYTELILKSRKIYLDHHVNKPGFFSLVVLTDEYLKAFNRLINFIYETYTNHSTEKPQLLNELKHFSEVAIPAMVNPIVDEIRESLSTPILQRKTMLRMYGVTSWKDLMPSQMTKNLNINDDM